MRKAIHPATLAALTGSCAVATFADTWALKAPALVIWVATLALIVKRLLEKEQA